MQDNFLLAQYQKEFLPSLRVKGQFGAKLSGQVYEARAEPIYSIENFCNFSTALSLC